ncbi:MAG: ribosome silencing factor [Spirochaetes bacterium]|nr:ribosome silencing factor [Spirochaetota bacterium]
MSGENTLPEMNRVALDTAGLLCDNRARDIVVLDLGGLTSITDYFIICTVTSFVQTKALVRSIEEYMDGHGMKPISSNVDTNSPWVLLDYNYLIIHIFLPEARDFYGLEKLWSDAAVVFADRGGIA